MNPLSTVVETFIDGSAVSFSPLFEACFDTVPVASIDATVTFKSSRLVFGTSTL
jgi:hypothetical protein